MISCNKRRKKTKLGNRKLQWSEHIYLFKRIPRRLKPHARLWMDSCMNLKTIVFTWSSSYKRRYKVGVGFICSAAPRLRSTLFTKSALGLKEGTGAAFQFFRCFSGRQQKLKTACLPFDMPSFARLMSSFAGFMCCVKAATLQVLFFLFFFLFLHTHVF